MEDILVAMGIILFFIVLIRRIKIEVSENQAIEQYKKGNIDYPTLYERLYNQPYEVKTFSVLKMKESFDSEEYIIPKDIVSKQGRVIAKFKTEE